MVVFDLPKKWFECHKPEDVKIWDHFYVKVGGRQIKIIINSITRIERHGKHGYLWEFKDRDSGFVFGFEDLLVKLEYAW